MTDKPCFSGSLVALVTPMDDTGAIDWNCLRQLVDWHVAAGTDGIVAVGTTGESPTLDMDEHELVIATIIKHVGGRLPVVAGTGANSTTEAIRLTKQACSDGADACLSVVPYYNKPTQEGLLRHFTAIADAATKPLILYNVPARTITDLADESLVELARHPRIVGIKDATGNLERLQWQREHIGADFTYLTGDDATSMDYVLSGGHGAISVTANIAPTMTHQMLTAARTGSSDATALNNKLAEFNRLQGIVANPIPVKWALHDRGRVGPGIRLPLTPLPAAHHAAVRDAIEELH